MNIVQFLEARIAEEEKRIECGNSTWGQNLHRLTTDEMVVPPSLTEALLAECAQKRAILADWKAAADEEGTTGTGQAAGTIAVARRSMLNILAAGYKNHPDYQAEWDV
ncbi:MAG: hypothetical protein JWQ07_5675 [Ramlibacter sp.]|jgi:hypothetical protein|nr:hypothetical protein [Ramlibacter sp.]